MQCKFKMYPFLTQGRGRGKDIHKGPRTHPPSLQPPLTRHNLFRRSESTFSLSLWILITLYAEERERTTHQEVTRPFVQIYGKGCRICSWSKPHTCTHTLPITAHRGVNDFIYSSKYNDVNIVRKHRKCSTNRIYIWRRK